MKKKLLSLFVLLSALTGCTFAQSSSSSTSTSSSFVIPSSTSIEPPSDTFEERIKTMVDTNRSATNDANEPEKATYNEDAPLGTAAHPLLNQPESSYLEIICFEQPEEYGDAFLLKCGDAEVIIDFGNYGSDRFDDRSSYRKYLCDFYSTYCEDGNIELIILSHPHSDHFGGYEGFIDSNLNASMIVDNGWYYQNSSSYRDYYDLMVNQCENYGAEHHHMRDLIDNYGARTYVTQELFIDWFDTPFYASKNKETFNGITYLGDESNDFNITSIVSMINYKNFSYWSAGDMQEAAGYESGADVNGESVMLKVNQSNPLMHKVTMMKAAHHCTLNATKDNLLTKLNPSLCLISAGRVDANGEYGNKLGACSGHPHVQTLTRIHNKRIPTYLNAISGTMHFVTNGTKVYFEGSALKSNVIGGTTSKGANKLTHLVGDTVNKYQEFFSSDFYSICHC